MNRFFLFFIFAALVAAYTGTSNSYQAELIVIDGSQPLTATSASYQLDAVTGTLVQGPNAGILFRNPGIGFERSTVAHPQLISNTTPSTTCCGPFVFTSRWTDLAGRGVSSVLFSRGDGSLNYTASLISGTVSDGTWQVSFSTSGPEVIQYRWYAETFDGLTNSSDQSTFTIVTAPITSGATATPVATVVPTAAPTSQPSSQTSPPILDTTTPTVNPPETKNFGEASRYGSSSASLSVNPSSGQSTLSLSFVPSQSGQQLVTWKISGLTRKDVEGGLVTFSPPEPVDVRYGSVIATWDVALRAGEEFKVNVEVAKVLPKSVIEELEPPIVKPKAAVSQESRPSEVPAAVTATAESPVPASSDNSLLYGLAAVVLLGAGYYFFTRKKHRAKGL